MREYEEGYDYEPDDSNLGDDEYKAIVDTVLDSLFTNWEDVVKHYLNELDVLSLEICIQEFRDEVLPSILNTYGEDDIVALNEEWSNYTDSLCRDGEITEYQYMNFPSWEEIEDGNY